LELDVLTPAQTEAKLIKLVEYWYREAGMRTLPALRHALNDPKVSGILPELRRDEYTWGTPETTFTWSQKATALWNRHAKAKTLAGRALDAEDQLMNTVAEHPAEALGAFLVGFAGVLTLGAAAPIAAAFGTTAAVVNGAAGGAAALATGNWAGAASSAADAASGAHVGFLDDARTTYDHAKKNLTKLLPGDLSPTLLPPAGALEHGTAGLTEEPHVVLTSNSQAVPVSTEQRSLSFDALNPNARGQSGDALPWTVNNPNPDPYGLGGADSKAGMGIGALLALLAFVFLFK
jgi:hypothetical protein